MGRGGKRARREGEMRARLEKWEQSGLPLSRFADREGIAQKTMYRWRRRLRVGDDRVRRGRPPVASVGGGDGERSQSASIFTEVSSAVRTASAAVTFEVVLRSGTTVRVPEHFDPGALSLLLQTLRGC
jgi:transposase-like protein